MNFDDLVQVGTKEQILDFLRNKNVLSSEKGFSFDKIMFLMTEKDFWLKVIKIFRQREIFVDKVWAESMRHLDPEALGEYLVSKNQLRLQGSFTSSLLGNSKKYRMDYKLLEYNPMINSRAHQVGQENVRNRILNKTFRETYDNFLQLMAYKKEVSFEEKMIFIYYLQLQDRIPEAIKLFKTLKINNLEGSLKIQHDYLSAYFDIFTGAENKYNVARTIIREYDNNPVSHWKMMFLAIEDLLNDFDGEFNDMQENNDDPESADKLSSQASLK